MDRTAFRPFVSENLEVTPRFSKNLCAIALDHTNSIPKVFQLILHQPP